MEDIDIFTSGKCAEVLILMETACKIQPNESPWSPLLKVTFRLKNDCRAPLSDFVCLENVIYITKQEKVSIYYLSPFWGEFVRAKRKPNFGNVIGQRKNSPRKSWISSYSFTCRFARTNSPSGKCHSSDCHSTSC